MESRIDQNIDSFRVQVTEVNKSVALAFVMINAQVGAEYEIVDAVKRMEYVKEAYVAYESMTFSSSSKPRLPTN